MSTIFFSIFIFTFDSLFFALLRNMVCAKTWLVKGRNTCVWVEKINRS